VVEYCVGLDLGQAQDFSALAVVERAAPPEDPGAGWYAVRHLFRWPLGTTYRNIAGDVAALVRRPPLSRPWLAIDQTGVGSAVLELFDPGDLAADLKPVLITGGHAVFRGDDGAWHVAKVQLVSTLQLLLQSRRLKVASELPLADVLRRELVAFRVKISAAGNESFEAWRERDHDDLVLAVALACWTLENAPRGRLQIYT
jgi:hypothetical protein